jgi:hypothetical protein
MGERDHSDIFMRIWRASRPFDIDGGACRAWIACNRSAAGIARQSATPAMAAANA